jgi:hypothetical protein
MELNQQKELFSKAYVCAVAAVAGFSVNQLVKQEFDTPQLIGEAIKTLEIVENRSQLEILSDLIKENECLVLKNLHNFAVLTDR